MFFGAIRSVCNNMADLGKPKNISFLLEDILSDKLIQAEILDMNIEDQLYNKGIDSKGDSLGQYSFSTIFYKQNIAAGLDNDTRIDHITLKDTGEFYRSFRFINQKRQFKIEADTIKEVGDNLLNFSSYIIGLTDENLQKVGEMVKEPFIQHVRRFIR